jgi:hypothetical protein
MVDLVTLDIEDYAIAQMRGRGSDCPSRWRTTADGVVVGFPSLRVKPLIMLSSTRPRCLHRTSYNCHIVSHYGR